jgi:hypothetical protein
MRDLRESRLRRQEGLKFLFISLIKLIHNLRLVLDEAWVCYGSRSCSLHAVDHNSIKGAMDHLRKS